MASRRGDGYSRPPHDDDDDGDDDGDGCYLSSILTNIIHYTHNGGHIGRHLEFSI